MTDYVNEIKQHYARVMEYARNFGKLPNKDYITLSDGRIMTIEVLIDIMQVIIDGEEYPENYEDYSD